jgi:plasmid stabilization system protein ParE
MPRGDKSSYTDKQKRQAEHIEEGYEHRGVSESEAERRAWATVNKETHGGKKSGSGRGAEEDHSPSRKGGRLGGAGSTKRPASERSRSAKKAAKTRKRRALPNLLEGDRARASTATALRACPRLAKQPRLISCSHLPWVQAP